jgi:hypothetical protein
MKWVTRERPKIDRIACPWLISRFIDRAAEFLFVPGDAVLATAGSTGATPFDVPGAELSHAGGRCSFDAFMAKYRLEDPALRRIATIVRGADTGRLDLTPQSAGLFAISQGLSRNYRNDSEALGHGLVIYDALYAWARKQAETTSLAEALRSAPHHVLATISMWRERRRQRLRLQELDDWMLSDIGITREEADGEVRKPFWMP